MSKNTKRNERKFATRTTMQVKQNYNILEQRHK